MPYIDPQGLKYIVIGWTQSNVPTLVIGKVTWEAFYPEGIADLSYALLELNERKSLVQPSE